jgi:hypothetical protein
MEIAQVEIVLANQSESPPAGIAFLPPHDIPAESVTTRRSSGVRKKGSWQNSLLCEPAWSGANVGEPQGLPELHSARERLCKEYPRRQQLVQLIQVGHLHSRSIAENAAADCFIGISRMSEAYEPVH